MPPQVALNFNISDKKERRRREWNDLVQQHPQLLEDPDTYNKAMGEYMQTGVIPASVTTGRAVRTDVTPLQRGSTGGVDTTVFPTTEVKAERAPVRLAQGYTLLNRETGEHRTLSDIPAGNQILTFDPTVPKPQASTLYVYNADGKLVETRPWKGSSDHVITLSRAPAGGGERNSPADRVHQLALAQFYRAASAVDRSTGNPLPITPEIQDAAVVAAEHFGLPWQTIQTEMKKPGFMAWLQRAVPGGESGMGTAETLKIGGPQGGAAPAPAPAAPAAGKPLTQAEAIAFLRQAGGDKQKAREPARQAGHTF